MKRFFGVLAVIALIGFAAAGCATLVAGTTQNLTVSSNVDGAEVYLDGNKIGTTPFTGAVPKNKGELRVEAEGYRPETVTLSKSLEPIFWGNIIIGGTVGSITDFASGAAYQYAPATYQVELRATGQTEASYRHQLAVRKFAILYVDEVSRDLSADGGDYLKALVALISGDDEAAVQPGQVAKALQRSGGNPVHFGNEMVSLIE